MRLSVVVPVLNEAGLIETCLHRLRESAPGAEVIVVDGGSDDGTAELAKKIADVVVRTNPGRAEQMNAGAAQARGEVLWFVHVDLVPPAQAEEEIMTALCDKRMAGGCFRLRFPRRELVYRICDSLGNVAVDIFGFALGDHGIFCRRAVFEKVGGFPEHPILEDAELYRKLARAGRMVQLRPAIVSSPRTFEKHGRYRTTALYFLILALYVLRAPFPILWRVYQLRDKRAISSAVTKLAGADA